MWRARELRTLLDNTSAIIYVKDSGGRYRLVNQHWEKRFHRTGQSVYGKTDYDLWPHDFADRNHMTDQMVLNLSARLELEETVRSPEGNHHYQTTKFALKGDHGKSESMCSISTDITELRRVDESLRATEEQARIIIESAKDAAIFSMDPEGHITSWNRGAEKLKGYKTQEILRQHFRIFYLPEEQKSGEAEKHLEEARQSETSEYSGIRVRKDGTHFWASMSLSVMRVNGEFRGFVKVVRDITEMRVVQQRLELANAELERRVSERTADLQSINKELEAFAYSLAHDLRAPVRSVNAFSQTLAKDLEAHLTDQTRDSLNRIQAAARQMDLMIDDLLSYSRLASSDVQFRSVSIQSVLAEVQQQLHLQIKETNARVRIVDAMPSVWSHRPILVRIFTNLLQNSMKFVEEGVTPEIKIESEVEGDRATIYVKDNGIGIAPPMQKKIFRLFERAHNSKRFQGTGVGLAIVRKGVERLGGQVGLKSEEGKGCCIWIELPTQRSNGQLVHANNGALAGKRNGEVQASTDVNGMDVPQESVP